MSTWFVIFTFVVIVVGTSVAYWVGFSLGEQKAHLDVSQRTSATLFVLYQGWTLLPDDAKFKGLLANVIDIHRFVNNGADAYPLRNLEKAMEADS